MKVGELKKILNSTSELDDAEIEMDITQFREDIGEDVTYGYGIKNVTYSKIADKYYVSLYGKDPNCDDETINDYKYADYEKK